jgi:alpha-tubulin suppressor-like RCC1 family protein
MLLIALAAMLGCAGSAVALRAQGRGATDRHRAGRSSRALHTPARATRHRATRNRLAARGYAEAGGARPSTAPLAPGAPALAAMPAFGPSPGTKAGASSGGAALAWGENYYGGLGQFYRDTREEWPVGVEGLDNITAVADGDSVTLALLANGEVDSWGANFHGQLGDNGFKANWELGAGHVSVHLSGATAVAAANEHALAMVGSAPTATVDAWGSNAYGTLGNGRAGFAVAHAPTPVPGLSGVRAIAAGGATDYALMANGTVEAWGANAGGQLSAEHWPLECRRRSTCKNPEYLCTTEAGQELCSKVPRLVVTATGKPLEHVKRIAAGAEAAYALLENGEVMSWGQDRVGQLGQYPAVEPGAHSDFRSPGLVMVSAGKGTEVLRGVSELAAGTGHVLVRLEDGEVLGWGDNAKGELGVAGRPEVCTSGTEIPCFKTARPIQGLAELIRAAKGHGAEALAAGGQYSLALIGHRVYAWGKNGDGELGEGTWLGPESCTSAGERAKYAGKAGQKETEAHEALQRERLREARGERILKTPQQIERELTTALTVLRRELEKAGACNRVPTVVRERGLEVEPGVAEPGAPVEHVSAIAAAPTHALALLEGGVAVPSPPITVTSGVIAGGGKPALPALTFSWSRDVERVLFRTFERPGEGEAEEEPGEGEGDSCALAEECVEIKEGDEGGSGPPISIALPHLKHQTLEEGELPGEFREGQVVFAGEGKWSGAEPMSFSFQWQRCSLLGVCVNVGAASGSSTYTVSSADVGSTLRVIVKATDGVEPATSATSAPTSLVKTTGAKRNSPGDSIGFKNPAPGGLMIDELEEGESEPLPLQEGVAYEFKLTNGEKHMTTVLTPSGLP